MSTPGRPNRVDNGVRSIGDDRSYVDRVSAHDAEVLSRLLDAFNAHDLDRIMSFFSDDCVLETPRGEHPWGTRFEGPAAVREGLALRFSGLPDVHYGEDEHWVCGDHGVSRWLLTGTTNEGDQVRVRGCDLFDLAEDGRVRRKDSYWRIVQPSQ